MRKLAILIMVISFVVAANVFSQNLMNKADSLWEERGETFNINTMIADSSNIDLAISLYKQIAKGVDCPEKEAAVWKLIRAYYYKGKYTTTDKELKKKIYDHGKELGEEQLKVFPDSPGMNLFTAIVWGVWGEEYGILAAARKGVAGKIKDLCEKTIELDPKFDEAGGYRVLGRVYFKAPKIWPILRWPSKEKAVEILKKSLDIAPDNLTSKQFYAEALYEQDQKEKAISIMNEILAAKEICEGVAEDAVIKNEVKATLKEWQEK